MKNNFQNYQNRKLALSTNKGKCSGNKPKRSNHFLFKCFDVMEF